MDGPAELKLSPEEFELEVKTILVSAGLQFDGLTLKHREVIGGVDGEYEIDLTARFTAFNVNFLVLVECKRYKAKVERDVVMVLHDKMRSVGAQKGMIFATSGFQKGAVDYASIHGIALVVLADANTTYFTRSLEPIANPPTGDVIGWLYGCDDRAGTLTAISEESTEKLTHWLKRPAP